MAMFLFWTSCLTVIIDWWERAHLMLSGLRPDRPSHSPGPQATLSGYITMSGFRFLEFQRTRVLHLTAEEHGTWGAWWLEQQA